MLTLPPSVKIYLARGVTDMRKSYDGLCHAVRSVLEADPFSGHTRVSTHPSSRVAELTPKGWRAARTFVR